MKNLAASREVSNPIPAKLFAASGGEFNPKKLMIGDIKSLWGYRLVLLMTALLAVDLGLVILFALDVSINLPTNHLDGAFQTSSALHRLADGQWPGRDFFPYLGMGLIYFLYPVFILAGNDLAASVFTAHFVVACAAAFGFGLLGALIFKSRPLLSGLVWASIFLSLVFWHHPEWLSWLTWNLYPGNSLRPLRAFLPYLCAAITYVLLNSRLSPAVTYGGIGGVAGAALLWSNDYGIPTSGLLGLFALFLAYRNNNLSIKIATSILGAAFAVAFAGLMVGTYGHGLALLEYNFFDVRLDQYWYFGPWSAESRILSTADFLPKIAADIGWLGIILACLFVITIFRPTIENILLLFIGFALVGGGILTIAGGHRESYYMDAFLLWCRATAVLYAAFLLKWVIEFTITRIPLAILKNAKNWEWPKVILILALLFLVGGVAQDKYRNYKSALAFAHDDQSRFYVAELGGYLPVAWEKHVGMARASQSNTPIEEYWGLWSSITRKPQNTPTDSVIHALGKTRDLYEKLIRAFPDTVITTPHSESTTWQPWNLSANWWFYRTLLANYTPTKTSPSTLVWRKSDTIVWPEAKCTVTNGELPFISVETKTPGFYEVTLDYKSNGLNSRTLVLVRNGLNFALGANGYLSMNLRATHMAFPVVSTTEENTVIDFQLVSATNNLSQLHLEQCQAKKILFKNSEVIPSSYFGASDTAYDLTDENWINGIAIRWAGFFVGNTAANLAELTPGKKISFVDGSERVIIKQTKNGPYLNIDLSSPPLDGAKVGYPKKFKVKK